MYYHNIVVISTNSPIAAAGGGTRAPIGAWGGGCTSTPIAAGGGGTSAPIGGWGGGCTSTLISGGGGGTIASIGTRKRDAGGASCRIEYLREIKIRLCCVNIVRFGYGVIKGLRWQNKYATTKITMGSDYRVIYVISTRWSCVPCKMLWKALSESLYSSRMVTVSHWLKTSGLFRWLILRRMCLLRRIRDSPLVCLCDGRLRLVWGTRLRLVLRLDQGTRLRLVWKTRLRRARRIRWRDREIRLRRARGLRLHHARKIRFLRLWEWRRTQQIQTSWD